LKYFLDCAPCKVITITQVKLRWCPKCGRSYKIELPVMAKKPPYQGTDVISTPKKRTKKRAK